MPMPSTMFLSQSFLKAWESKSEGLRNPAVTHAPTGARRQKRKRNTQQSDYEPFSQQTATEDDVLEPHMTIPKSALDACGQSFVAADGERVKASTRFFDDTGLMALLCRHDRVLYVANMWTAGEKQFYALALIDTLHHHLPHTWKVGLLYDISCQLHRTLSKWDERLPGWLGRLEFAVSVFHAYGHQWCCQLWYHPRKSRIWGLSDGEGCERFWAELRKLIPGLRVTGVSRSTAKSLYTLRLTRVSFLPLSKYHRRLMIVDMQIQHVDQVKMQNVGQWLSQRLLCARERSAASRKALATCGLSTSDETRLLAEFAAQRQFQSRPLESELVTLQCFLLFLVHRNFIIFRVSALQNKGRTRGSELLKCSYSANLRRPLFKPAWESCC